MRVLVTGAAGMLGTRLVKRLLDQGSLAGHPVTAIDLFDAFPCTPPDAPGVEIRTFQGDIADAAISGRLAASRPDFVFHLASIVSGEAETNFDLGYRVNLQGGLALLEALRTRGNRPRFVFSSSGAVFGGPVPDLIDDDFAPTPLTSYGSQKLIVEALVQDYTRKGFIEGISIRLPAICIRPGKPNKAASGFYSGIIREPLNGVEAVVPVSRDIVHSSASPRSAVGFLIHAAEIDSDRIGHRRSLNMPGVFCTVGEQIEAMARVAGPQYLRLLRDEIDPAIERIVSTWPKGYRATRAKELGFTAEADFDEIIRIYIDEEMPDGLSPLGNR
ncbi:SDR family oxidoreductase [Mesorhizobium sp. M4B.F.Ca.ET.190.01.1.1]|uniref:D-erythronate dehydrogenase n=1 Tax=unclassified Mesorhizobium TaxID=325217 RepID=UPI001092A318|nr:MULTISPECIES: D-erythronate dehydrogenase [unclassified Mesorhizobium]TGR10505.1 SDR family oxidoreductase [Mesorhizobium sp. M4B.F.Ca.ET.200.01.1.1]TGS19595.1 SDR family oxidoreductase [Mesorhizobium sp. M4B.F.Ca.ET.190.01.1.1]TGT32438.1 SDR family oxidoreductase [Mesorhizobium sp. M4B.F.Ca.ET.172.01.1.1]